MTLELALRLRRNREVHVHAFTLAGESPEAGGVPRLKFHAVRPRVARPVLVKSMIYHASAAASVSRIRRLDPKRLIHAAGACAMHADIVQVHFVHKAWRDARQRLGISFSGSRYARAYHEILERYDLAAERLAFDGSRPAIANSWRVAGEIRRFYPAVTRIAVVKPGVDADRFAPRPEGDGPWLEIRKSIGATPQSIVAVFAGAYERKNLATAIGAVARARAESGADVRLLAVGGGDAKPYLRQADQLGIARSVALRPLTKQIADYLRAGDLFLLPTLYEPFGMSILEAMSCGLPVVASAVAGAAELIQEGKNGFLLERPEDPESVGARLVEALRASRANPNIALAARAAALDQSWDRVCRRYDETLDELSLP